MSRRYRISDTLSLELVNIEGVYCVRIIRENGGLVVVTLDEGRQLISSLAVVVARGRALIANEPYQDNLF